MFIRTREEEGFIFYIGSDVHHPTVSYITGQLYKGNLLVSVNFEGKQERFQVCFNIEKHLNVKISSESLHTFPSLNNPVN